MRIAGKSYSHIGTWGPVEISDSFVARTNKLISASGNGEAKFYVGGKQDKSLRVFFGKSKFLMRAFFAKDELVSFMEEMKVHYVKESSNYRALNTLPTLWKSRITELKLKSSKELWFDAAEQDAGGQRRCYIKGDGNFELLRELPLPDLAVVMIDKYKSSAGDFVFKFRFVVRGNDQELPISATGIEFETRDEHEDRIVIQIDSDKSLTKTERLQLIRARVGQGVYRDLLIASCGAICPISLVDDERRLVASHIKPWRNSTNQERLDPFNGFLLTPTYDLLFDQGFITFEQDCRLKVSSQLDDKIAHKFGLIDGAKFPRLPLSGDVQKKRRTYLEYHQLEVFLA